MVAGHRFCVEGDSEVLALMDNYAPFGCEAGDTIATLHIAQGEAPDFQEEMRQDDEGQTIICGRTASGEHVFGFLLSDSAAGWLICNADYRDARLIIANNDSHRLTKFALDNALMVLTNAPTTLSATFRLFFSSYWLLSQKLCIPLQPNSN